MREFVLTIVFVVNFLILLINVMGIRTVAISYVLDKRQWECTKSELVGPTHYQEDQCIQYNGKPKPPQGD